MSRFGVVYYWPGSSYRNPYFASKRKAKGELKWFWLVQLIFFFITNLPYEHETDSFLPPFWHFAFFRVWEQALVPKTGSVDFCLIQLLVHSQISYHLSLSWSVTLWQDIVVVTDLDSWFILIIVTACCQEECAFLVLFGQMRYRLLLYICSVVYVMTCLQSPKRTFLYCGYFFVGAVWIDNNNLRNAFSCSEKQYESTRWPRPKKGRVAFRFKT